MLDTERLHIREITGDDWQKMKEIALDFRASEYAVYDRPLPVEDDAIRELTARFAASGLFFGVFLRDDGDMTGYVCFHADGDSMDLGYCFHSRYQGMGYAYESCRALMAELEKSRGVRKFTAGTALANAPSCRLLEKLGFRQIGMERVSFSEGDGFEGGLFEK